MSFVGNYKLLSTKPIRRFFSKDHPEWLSVLPLVDIDDGDIVALIRYTDDSTVQYTILNDFDFKAGQVRHIDISYATHDYDSVTPAKTIKSIRIDLKSALPNGESFTYFPYTPKGDTLKAIYYYNSFGGRDTLIGKGDIQEAINSSHLLTRRSVVPYNTNTVDHNYKLEQAVGHRAITFHSGPFPKKEIKALRCLQLHKVAYEYLPIQQAFVPIILQGDVLQYPSERENVWKAQFSYRYTFDDRAFDRIV